MVRRGVVVIVVALAACGGNGASAPARPGSLVERVALAAGCDAVELVDPDPGFRSAGTCEVRGAHVRVDVNADMPMSGLVQRFNTGGFGGNPCPDGTAVTPPWISVGEGWMVLSTSDGPARAAARALDGELLDEPAHRGTPISFPVDDADLICPGS